MEDFSSISIKLQELELSLSAEKIGKIEQYIAELKKWNKTYNLVGKSTLDSVYSRHILDALQLCKCIKKCNSILDFGSGGGIPAVIIAIVFDCIEVTACERIGKKCQFLNNIRRKLALTNFTVHQGDVRELDYSFDIITCRAVATISEIFSLTKSIKNKNQSYILPKGRDYLKEINDATELGFEFDFSIEKSIVESDSVILNIQI